MELVLIFVLLLGAVAIIGRPLMRPGRVLAHESARRADLEAAKEAKYREIRELELDFRTGKLSEADYKTLDREVRAEAIEILRKLDELGEEEDATISS